MEEETTALGTEGSSPYRTLGGLEAGRDQVTYLEVMRLCGRGKHIKSLVCKCSE